MKQRLICLCIVLIWLFSSSACADTPKITYEQLVSGEYNGQDVEVNAKALPIRQFFNLIYIWSVEREDGSFEIVDNTQTRWCVSEEDYEKASASEKKTFDEQGVFTLEVNLRNDGRPTVLSFRILGELSSDEQTKIFVVGFLIIITLLIIVLVISNKRKKSENIERPAIVRAPEPELLKTKIIDTSHTATASSRSSVSSAAGRAVIGSMLFGPVGGLVGASTAKKKTTVSERHTTTFMLFYSDGTRKHVTVSNGSWDYNKYMEKLEL